MSEWAEITSFSNLVRAARRAARGKRRVAGTARFLERLEPACLALQRRLGSGTWRPSPPTTFWIHDPKRRRITAAPFADRVVHHALIDPLEERFDASLLPITFACRRNLGMHRALDHAQHLVREHDYFLKLDVASCFDSIRHGIVRETLEPLGLAPRTRALFDAVLCGPHGTDTVGLPIGNLTSQWAANLVLGRLDRFVVEWLGIEAYARYMDDFVLFAESKASLRDARSEIESFLARELHLALKERATQLAPTRVGLPFLGWRLFGATRRLRPENARRTRARRKHRRHQLREGVISPQDYRAALASIAAHLAHGDTLHWRRAHLAPLAADEALVP